MSELGNVLEFNTFNPEKIDVSYIQELSKNIPKDGHVDKNIADKLAIQFLRGSDFCAELMGKLTWWVAKKKDQARAKFQEAALITAPAKGYKTASEKKIYADGDAEYLEAHEEFSKAEAMLQWCKNKHSSLISAHYMMKHISKNEESNLQASGVPTGEIFKNGVQSW